MPLTSEAKKLLAETIRGTQQDPAKGLRARLLRAIHDEAERRYRLSVSIADAGLDEAHRRRRERIEAWIDERTRATKPKSKTESAVTRNRLLLQAENEAAATFLNRFVLLRLLEAHGLSKPLVLTGGWNSKGYREFREFAQALTGDDTEGYGTLLQLLFDELATDLPGLFGEVGLTRLFPVPSAMLRDAVERLDNPELASAWTDDTTFGWTYQYWNDPDREALDDKLKSGDRIKPHEVASKTQTFTERYMVEWLLQNSLGLTWLAMCRKQGWIADAEQVLPVLEGRRVDWRAKREAGEVALDALLPIEGDLEEHWRYYVLQPIPDDVVANAPESVRAIKILDPAAGSGHFLVIAFDLLVALYREEARHRGNTVTDKEIAESILENNLHGIDIDPRAIQIAAAGLYLKAKTVARTARPTRLNLVAPVLQLGNLPPDDPAVVALRKDLKNDVRIPEELTNNLLTSLAGVDYLGSLLKVDTAVEEAIRNVELEFERSHGQGDLFGGFPAQQVKLSVVEAKASILDKLEQFLSKHSKSEDLGLRLDGEQLAAGVRFVRMAKEGSYDVVVGNPPYLGIAKTTGFEYVARHYPQGRADLYAAFMLRGLELVRASGISAFLTIRGWLSLGQFAELRKVLRGFDLRSLGDFDRGAFEEEANELAVTAPIVRRAANAQPTIAILPTPFDDRSYDRQRTRRKRAALLAQVGRHEFDPRGFEVIDGEPIVYWWSKDFLAKYAAAPKLGDVSPARFGLNTGNNVRFLRRPWELRCGAVSATTFADAPPVLSELTWSRYLKGAAGVEWMDPCDDAIQWTNNGLEVKVMAEHLYGSYSRQIRNERVYWVPGVAFTMIGSAFSARAHRFRCVIDSKGSSVYPESIAECLCIMNRAEARSVLASLNPTISFQVGDVNRLPVFPVSDAKQIFASISGAFASHEAARETSAEFKRPAPSPWRAAQRWAREEVDRKGGEALSTFVPEYQQPDPEAFVSAALGIALGRFGANGEGILDGTRPGSLSSGILFASTEPGDSLDTPPCAALRDAWLAHGAGVGEGDDLRTYLRKSFFDFHKKLYANRPIYFPLSSTKKSFVAYVSIHLWADDTLNVLLADHLVPTKRRLDGELDDLRTARASGNNKGKAEKRFTEVQKLVEELNTFIAKVTEVTEKGPPPSDDKTEKRHADTKFVMDLDDGVMVNSAALWPLLEPQWKDPKKWWKELANAQGKKHYDWSHLAARYFPTRVRKKCHEDPSLAVAHKCFWDLHPAKAYAWELRLRDEIRPDFTIDEPGSDAARARYLKEHERDAGELFAKELKRREKKAAKADDEGEADPLFEQGDDADAEESDA